MQISGEPSNSRQTVAWVGNHYFFSNVTKKQHWTKLCYLSTCCQKHPLLKILPWVQTVYNIYLCFWFMGLMHKNHHHVSFVLQLSCGNVDNNNPPCLSSLACAVQGLRWVGQCGPNIPVDVSDTTTYQGPNIKNLSSRTRCLSGYFSVRFDIKDLLMWTKCLHEHFAQDHMSANHHCTFFLSKPSGFKSKWKPKGHNLSIFHTTLTFHIILTTRSSNGYTQA